MSESKLYQFLLSMAKIGCMGFGGGSILIPVIEQEIIKDKKIDSKEQYDKDVVVASITPGALPVEIAALVGRRNFGHIGMFLGAMLMALPGAFVTVLLLSVLSVVQSGVLNFIEFLSIGVTIFVILLLTQYIYNVSKKYRMDNLKEQRKAIFVMTVVFFLSSGKNIYRIFEIDRTPMFSVSTVNILAVIFFFALYTRGKYTYKHLIVSAIIGGIFLLGSGNAQIISNPYILKVDKLIMLILSVYGIVSSILKTNYKAKVELRSLFGDVGIWFGILGIFAIMGLLLYPESYLFILDGILSVLMSFGGGDAYLTVADGLFVDSGMITETQYYGQIVSIVNILPGSILCKTLAAVGYYFGLNIGDSVATGVLFALIGFIASVAASCGFCSIIYYFYDSLVKLNIFQTISRWIRPIIAGLLINIMLSLCNQCGEFSVDWGVSKSMMLGILFLAYLVNLFLLVKCKLKEFMILIIDVSIMVISYVFIFII